MDVANNSDEFFMRKALTEAHKALDRQEVPIGAVVVCAGAVIGSGYNMSETLSDATAHAEMQALTAASNSLGGKYLRDCTLYVTVEPCVMCAGACFWTQISRIVYGAPEPKYGFSRIGYPILHPKTQVASGVLEAECTTLMREFFKKLR